ncbi:sulfatase-like hydrolase/transferase [Thalassotalea fonticola]|uniref:Sulfatase-like hydrolase/transferase n=1 Tax=Thalassotalea fonticola TaxID=3065649 RepID=A0ABZ0GQV2_9GAMM|nr:sulfatase-like hydrolase/transferase [Colwelliaceae bacterium S1-1]
MKALLTKKNILLAILLLLLLKTVITIFVNINGQNIDNERTDKYLQTVRAAQNENEQEKLPNIVFILTDDLGYGDLSSYGSTLINTPNIDALADQGIKLTNFYSPSSLCSPARAGILTGRYPQRAHVPAVLFDSDTVIGTVRKYLGYYSYGMDGLSPDEATVSEVLQAKGYSTAVLGKWHLGSRAGYLPKDNGFDYAYIPDDTEDKTTLTKKFTKKIVNFIDENKANPFFVYYSQPIPHEPLFRVKEFADKTKAGKYGEMVQEVDWSIGVIMKKLAELGLEENTLVIFSSDNGPYRLGNSGGVRGGKGQTTLGGQRVPFIAYWPGVIPAGQVSDEMAMGFDIFPTALSMAGIPLPDDRIIDGKNILPLLTGEEKQSPHEYLYMINDKTVESVLDKQGNKYQIRTNPPNSKFWYMKTGPYFFNVYDDPSESYSTLELNLEKADAYKNKINAFQAELDNDLRGWR